MSLNHALELLKIAHELIEIGEGIMSDGSHALILQDDCLVLSINTGSEFKNFILDDKDLNRDPRDLIIDIMRLLIISPTMNLKDMN